MVSDRYLAYDAEYGWDLATGERARVSAPEPHEALSCPPFAALIEVLDHGREAMPRWVTMEAGEHSLRDAIRRAAADARARGYVAVAVDVYRRLRDPLHDALQDRTLLLIASADVPVQHARAALLDAAAHAPRPHVLLSIRAAPRPGQMRGARAALSVVREARAAYAPDRHPAQTPDVLPEDVARHVLRGAKASELLMSGRHAAAERLLRDVTAALARRRAFAEAARSSTALGRLLLERGRPEAADAAFADAGAHAEAGDDQALACEAGSGRPRRAPTAGGCPPLSRSSVPRWSVAPGAAASARTHTPRWRGCCCGRAARRKPPHSISTRLHPTAMGLPSWPARVSGSSSSAETCLTRGSRRAR